MPIVNQIVYCGFFLEYMWIIMQIMSLACGFNVVSSYL